MSLIDWWWYSQNTWLALLLVQRIFKCKGKGKVSYGQEPPGGESTTRKCGVNYELLAVMLLK